MQNVKQIRRDMKTEIGYNSKQVSVSCKRGNVSFTIRDENINSEKVKEFSYQYENISRDYATGCILSGGNTFVDVKFAKNLNDVFDKKYEKIIEERIKSIKTDSDLVEIGNWTIGNDWQCRGMFIARKDKIRVSGSNSEQLSNQICKNGGIVFKNEKPICDVVEFAGNIMTLI